MSDIPKNKIEWDAHRIASKLAALKIAKKLRDRLKKQIRPLLTKLRRVNQIIERNKHLE